VSSFDKEILLWLENCTFPVLERFSLHIKQKANAVLIFAALLTACHESKTFQHVTHVRLCLSDDQSAFSLGGYLSAILPQLFPNLKCFDCFGDSTDNIVPMAEEIVGNFVKDKFGIGDGENRQDDSAEEEKRTMKRTTMAMVALKKMMTKAIKIKTKLMTLPIMRATRTNTKRHSPTEMETAMQKRTNPKVKATTARNKRTYHMGQAMKMTKGYNKGRKSRRRKTAMLSRQQSMLLCRKEMASK
jgi:hypothetical protein